MYEYFTDKKESKRVITNACSLDKNELKSVHISVNMKKVKYEKNQKFISSKLKDVKNERKYE